VSKEKQLSILQLFFFILTFLVVETIYFVQFVSLVSSFHSFFIPEKKLDKRISIVIRARGCYELVLGLLS
jgi:5-bromo-4-chloroindolyl phosphate hydrolysis protein